MTKMRLMYPSERVSVDTSKSTSQMNMKSSAAEDPQMVLRGILSLSLSSWFASCLFFFRSLLSAWLFPFTYSHLDDAIEQTNSYFILTYQQERAPKQRNHKSYVHELQIFPVPAFPSSISITRYHQEIEDSVCVLFSHVCAGICLNMMRIVEWQKKPEYASNATQTKRNHNVNAVKRAPYKLHFWLSFSFRLLVLSPAVSKR